MSVQPVTYWPNEALTKTSAPVEAGEFGSDALKQLVQDLVDTCADKRGVGIAAPQIGVYKRVIVIPSKSNEPLALVNPVITEYSEEKMAGEEGCLSLPTVMLKRERSKSITLKAQKLLDGALYEMKLEDFDAMVIQHEVDHLDGKTIADGIGPVKRDLVRAKVQKARRREEQREARRRMAYEDSRKDYRMLPRAP